MEGVQRLTHRLCPLPFTGECLRKTFTRTSWRRPKPLNYSQNVPKPSFNSRHFHRRLTFGHNRSSHVAARAGWFLGMGEKKQLLPEIVKAGDPVLHEPAQEVPLEEIGSERVQKIIEDMIKVMRKAPGVGLAAPQIGIPLKTRCISNGDLPHSAYSDGDIRGYFTLHKIIVLEDTKEYISYAPKNEIKVQDRQPFDLLVIINPKLKKKGNKTALFFEGCLSVDGFRAVVERSLEVEVTGLDKDGKAIKIDASGWQARILQHEYDHLEGTLYVDKMVPRTFRTVENLDLPLATGCPKLGVSTKALIT